MTFWTIDLDNNTFEGFNQLRQTIAQDDPHQMQYTQDLTLIVRNRIDTNIQNETMSIYYRAFVVAGSRTQNQTIF